MDPYNEGYTACYRGFARAHNPYAEGSTNWKQWRLGWHDAWCRMAE